MFEGISFCGDEEQIIKLGILENIYVAENEMDDNLVDTIFARGSHNRINSRITMPPQKYADLL